MTKRAFLSSAILIFLAGAIASAHGLVPPPASRKLERLPDQIVLGPIYRERHFCSEHSATSWDLGDSLGTDCIVVSDYGHGFPKFYKTNGKKNADWYGWHVNVLAPVDGKVVGVYVNNVENTP